MSCPTCDHNMQQIGEAGSGFWCPRCGTIQVRLIVYRPKLVDRCREMEDKLITSELHKWQRLGIHKSIQIPFYQPSAALAAEVSYLERNVL